MSAMKNTTPRMALAGKCGERAPRSSSRHSLDVQQPVVADQDAKAGGERNHDRQHRDDAERHDDVVREPLADVERQARQQLVIHHGGFGLRE